MYVLCLFACASNPSLSSLLSQLSGLKPAPLLGGGSVSGGESLSIEPRYAQGRNTPGRGGLSGPPAAHPDCAGGESNGGTAGNLYHVHAAVVSQKAQGSGFLGRRPSGQTSRAGALARGRGVEAYVMTK